jgi:hypothetical protein
MMGRHSDRNGVERRNLHPASDSTTNATDDKTPLSLKLAATPSGGIIPPLSGVQPIRE